MEAPSRKRTCADCSGPREADSTYYSYCKSCGRKRQRDRYRAVRAAAGMTVVSRIDDGVHEDRRTYLLRSSNKPGPCELCGQPEPDGLRLLYEGDPTDDPFAPTVPPQLYAVACRECHRLLHSVNALELRKLVLIAHYLDKHRTPRERVLPDYMPNKNAPQNATAAPLEE